MGPPRPPRITAGYHTFVIWPVIWCMIRVSWYLQICYDIRLVGSMIPCYDTAQICSDKGQHVCDMYFQIREWYRYDTAMIYTWYAHDTHMKHKCIFVRIFGGNFVGIFVGFLCEQVPIMTLRAYLMYQTRIIYVSNCITCISDTFWPTATHLWYVLSDTGNDTAMIYTWYAHDMHMIRIWYAHDT